MPIYLFIGDEHNVMFTTCACEPLVFTIARAHLWPSSPQRPQYGFSFELLDWAEALLLEAQESLNDFCKAVHFKCCHNVTKVFLFNNLLYMLEGSHFICLCLF